MSIHDWQRHGETNVGLGMVCDSPEEKEIESLRNKLAEAKKDVSRLDWAEGHPEKFYGLVCNWWANAGRGFREMHFNWRGIIDGAMKESKP